METLQVINNDKELDIRGGVEGLLNRFIAFQDVNERSKETYRKSLNQFFRYVRDNNISNLKREDILTYKLKLKQSNYSAYTITNYITAIRKFFSWTDTEGIYNNVAKDIKGSKHPKGFRKETLTVSQVKRVLDSIDRDTLRGKRDYALLNLLVRTGLRTIEVARADIEDLSQQGGEAILHIQGKGRDTKDDFVLLTSETLEPIMAYLSQRGANDNEPLFASISDRNNGGRLTTRSISRIVKNFLVSVGLDSKKLSAHSFRHTAITFSLLGGATIQEAQTMARHANINTTLIYAHNIDRVQKAPERKISSYLAGLN